MRSTVRARRGAARDPCARRLLSPTASLALPVVALALAGAPQPACADAHACAGRSTPRHVARTTLGLSLVPLGAELQARAGLCVPLRPWDGDWLDLAALEVGPLAAVSPVYAAGGGYVQLTPANLIAFRIEVLGLGYWTGYQRLDAADAPRDASSTAALAHDEGATGWTVRALTTVQAHIPVGHVSILVWDTVFGERTSVGSGPYFVNLLIDHTQRASDIVVGNDAALVLEVVVRDGPHLRVGGYDSLRATLGSGSMGNQTGVVLAVGWGRPIAEISWMEIGLRLGEYTSHPLRGGELQMSAWATIEWDLGGL